MLGRLIQINASTRHCALIQIIARTRQCALVQIIASTRAHNHSHRRPCKKAPDERNRSTMSGQILVLTSMAIRQNARYLDRIKKRQDIERHQKRNLWCISLDARFALLTNELLNEALYAMLNMRECAHYPTYTHTHTHIDQHRQCRQGRQT